MSQLRKSSRTASQAHVPSDNPSRSSVLLPRSGSSPNESLCEMSQRLTGRTTDSSSVYLSPTDLILVEKWRSGTRWLLRSTFETSRGAK